MIRIPDRYHMSGLRRVVNDPSIIFGEMNRIGTYINQLWYQRQFSPDGVEILSKDWDILIILDACRYDTFERLNYIGGDLTAKKSSGSNSWEFMQANFVGQTAHDTVYITANAHAHKLEAGIFHDLIPLYSTHWSESQKTVLPSEVRTAALNAAEEYPDKRLIIHFMQPHAPFIGEYAQSLPISEGGPTVWQQLRYGMGVTLEQIEKAYEENLRLVLSEVETLVENISGKAVITSDHGELLGERLSPIPIRGYEHNPNLYVPKLLTIPWFTTNGKTRREVKADPPTRANHVDNKVVAERLQDLGYI